MPTLTVETNVNLEELRRTFTKEVSLWLRARDVNVNHVITKFINVDAHSVYSGPFPFSYRDDGQAASFAFVRIEISHRRSHQFLKSFSFVCRQILSNYIEQESIMVSFLPVNPENYFSPAELADVAG